MTVSTPGNGSDCLGRTCLKWCADGELTAVDFSLVMERLALVDQQVRAEGWRPPLAEAWTVSPHEGRVRPCQS